MFAVDAFSELSSELQLRTRILQVLAQHVCVFDSEDTKLREQIRTLV